MNSGWSPQPSSVRPKRRLAHTWSSNISMTIHVQNRQRTVAIDTAAVKKRVLQIMAYLRSLNSVSTPAEAPAGNVEHGKQLFTSNCATCHRVNGQGGRLGPDLSRIGVARSRAALTREIRTPSEWIAPNYETVTLVTKDGQKIRAIKKNEDAFSIQVMDARERLQGYVKANLQDVQHETVSMMPTFPAQRLNDSDLNDLIGYLTTLRGTDVAAVR